MMHVEGYGVNVLSMAVCVCLWPLYLIPMLLLIDWHDKVQQTSSKVFLATNSTEVVVLSVCDAWMREKNLIIKTFPLSDLTIEILLNI